MNLDNKRLFEAADSGIITREQAEKLWQFLQEPGSEIKGGQAESSTMSNFLYYLGALIVISAMGWLMNTAWQSFAGVGLFSIAAVYAVAFCLAGYYFRVKSTVLSGLLFVMAVGMTPLGVFGIEKWFDLWPHGDPGYYRDFYTYIKGGWFAMELATIIAGVISLRFSKIPFATAPIAFTLWFMSMDITPILAGPDYDFVTREYVSVAFGLIILIIAYLFDNRSKIDYAKWLYIFGAITFWGGLSLLRAGSEWGKLIYCLINVVLMFAGVLINRKVFIVFGGLGFFGYLGYLSWTVFKASVIFPFILTLLGLIVVYLGWLYHRKQAKVVEIISYLMPAFILNSLPQNRRQKARL
jgi:hypothetical protein